jgi:hypothetical protein
MGLVELIKDPEALCDEFNISPKPYWLLVIQTLLTQIAMGMLFRKKPRDGAWLADNPTRFEVYFVMYQVFFGVINCLTVAVVSQSSKETSFGNYQRYVYMLSQSSGAIMLAQIISVQCLIKKDYVVGEHGECLDAPLLELYPDYRDDEQEQEHKEQESSWCSSCAKTWSWLQEKQDYPFGDSKAYLEKRLEDKNRLQESINQEMRDLNRPIYFTKIDPLGPVDEDDPRIGRMTYERLYSDAAFVLSVFFWPLFFTHYVPMVFAYLWLWLPAHYVDSYGDPMKGNLEVRGRLQEIKWLDNLFGTKPGIMTDALRVSFIAFCLTIVLTTMATYGVLLYDGVKYVDVFYIENQSRYSSHYFKCMKRKLSGEWATVSDLLTLF